MKLLFELNPDRASEDTIAQMTRRTAARGLVTDESGRVCLMHVTKARYCKLPGGGLEADESPEVAFIRECLEETGYTVEITEDLGVVEEYRTDINRHQTSHCFVGRILGERTSANLDAGEAADGFQAEWFEPDEALKALQPDTNHKKRLIVERDLRILEAALR